MANGDKTIMPLMNFRTNGLRLMSTAFSFDDFTIYIHMYSPHQQFMANFTKKKKNRAETFSA